MPEARAALRRLGQDLADEAVQLQSYVGAFAFQCHEPSDFVQCFVG